MDYSGIVKCMNFAALKHCNQRRKNSQQTPYINHPVGEDWNSHCIFSRSTDITSIDLVLSKGKTKEVYCCDIVVLVVVLMFLMREGL